MEGVVWYWRIMRGMAGRYMSLTNELNEPRMAMKIINMI